MKALRYRQYESPEDALVMVDKIVTIQPYHKDRRLTVIYLEDDSTGESKNIFTTDSVAILEKRLNKEKVQRSAL